MPKDCQKCETTLKPADEFNCSRTNFICPNCAPNWVLCRATSHTDLDPQEYGYTEG